MNDQRGHVHSNIVGFTPVNQNHVHQSASTMSKEGDHQSSEMRATRKLRAARTRTGEKSAYAERSTHGPYLGYSITASDGGFVNADSYCYHSSATNTRRITPEVINFLQGLTARRPKERSTVPSSSYHRPTTSASASEGEKTGDGHNTLQGDIDIGRAQLPRAKSNEGSTGFHVEPDVQHDGNLNT